MEPSLNLPWITEEPASPMIFVVWGKLDGSPSSLQRAAEGSYTPPLRALAPKLLVADAMHLGARTRTVSYVVHTPRLQ